MVESRDNQKPEQQDGIGKQTNSSIEEEKKDANGEEFTEKTAMSSLKKGVSSFFLGDAKLENMIGGQLILKAQKSMEEPKEYDYDKMIGGKQYLAAKESYVNLANRMAETHK